VLSTGSERGALGMGRSGFSMIELAIVCTVLGVIAMIAVPRLLVAFRQQATTVAADRFVRAHELTRATAVRYGRVAQLHIDPVGGRFWVDVDTSGTSIRDTVGPIHYDLKDLQVQMASPDSLMCFDARGLPSTTASKCQVQNVMLVFSSSGRYDTVTITTLGKVLR
jgi:prepilin-type N-terminal cleavage/methylation domain-containing protein